MKRILLLMLILNIFYLKSQAERIEISSLETLQSIDPANSAGNTYVLTSDIKIESWTPIGSLVNPFRGVFDGNGYSISFTKQITVLTSLFGLFGYIENATLQNLDISIHKTVLNTLEQTQASQNYFGGIVGKIKDSYVSNCVLRVDRFSGKAVSNAYIYIGAIGYSEASIISNCNILGINNSEGYNIRIDSNDKLLKGYLAGICGFCDAGTKLINNGISNLVIYPGSKPGNVIYSGFSNGGNVSGNENNLVLDLKTVDASVNPNLIEVTNDLIKISSREILSITLLNSTSKNLICDFDGILFCDNNSVGKLELGAGVMQKGIINSESAVLHDGCHIDADGINNEGEIYYIRQPKCWTTRQTGSSEGNGNGWETLCLPFDAVLCAGDEESEDYASFTEKHPLFTGVNGRYWLRSYDGAENISPVFTDAMEIKANTPYIIALPGQGYSASLNLSGKKIIYKGSGKITSNHKTLPVGKTFIPVSHTYQNTTTGYVLNSEAEYMNTLPELVGGFASNKFIMGEKLALTPSRVYLSADFATTSTLRILYRPNQATSISDIEQKEGNLQMYTADGVLVLRAVAYHYPVVIINALTGTVIRNIGAIEGEVRIEDLPKGVYIVNGRKVII